MNIVQKECISIISIGSLRVSIPLINLWVLEACVPYGLWSSLEILGSHVRALVARGGDSWGS